MQRRIMIAAVVGVGGGSGLCLGDLTYVAQTRTISVTTMADGQTTDQVATDFAPFVATVSRNVPAVVEGVMGVNAGTTDISCHFDREIVAATVRMLAQGVVGQTTQVNAMTTTLVDVTFDNTLASPFRLILTGADIAALGVNDVTVRLTSVDDGTVFFQQQASTLDTNFLGQMPTGRMRFEFLAMQTSAVGQCGRDYEVELTVPARPCDADFDDGTFTGVPDYGVTVDDLLYYLYLFELGDRAADLDDGSGRGHRDHAVTIEDLLYYLVHFEGGC